MRRTLIAGFAAPALALALLTPIAQADTPPPQPPGQQQPPTSGADCAWGTEPAEPIPVVNYPRGYMTGADWSRENPSPYTCALGPSWVPFMLRYPIPLVMVSSDEFNGFNATQHLCDGLGDATCSPKDWKRANAELGYGYCSTDDMYGCIESLEVIDPDGQKQQARLLRGFPEVAAVPEYRSGAIYLPPGGSVPLWEYDTASGPQRLLSIAMTISSLTSEGGAWVPRNTEFKMILRPTTIESRPSLVKPGYEESVDPVTGVTRVYPTGGRDVSAQDCIAVDTGECAVESTFPDGYRFRITLRQRDITSMYLNGALNEPVVFSEELPGGHRFVIEAGASPVLGMAGWIPKAQVPTSLMDSTFNSIGGHRNWDVNTNANSAQPFSRGGKEALAWLKAFMPYFADRASFIVNAWYVENTPTVGRYTSQCVNQGKGEFIGIVSSNATAYTGDPPTYDAATSTLSYEIAGPHYMPDGTTLSKGRYSINMNADFVKCVLGVQRVPSMARVELIYPDGEASAATLALKQDKNWLRLYYENFTFSNPTVNVSFPGPITCVKGKGKKAQTKTFVAFQCPKGWKLKG